MTRKHGIYCDVKDDGSRALYTLTCKLTGETQQVIVCQRHGEKMPLINDDTVRAEPAEGGLRCDFYGAEDQVST